MFSAPPVAAARFVNYTVADSRRTVAITRYSTFLKSERSTIGFGIGLFGRNTEYPDGGFIAGNEHLIHMFLKKAEVTDRPFTWGLVYDTLDMAIEGGPSKRMGNLMPLLSLNVYDVLVGGEEVLAATGQIGRLVSENSDGSGSAGFMKDDPSVKKVQVAR